MEQKVSFENVSVIFQLTECRGALSALCKLFPYWPKDQLSCIITGTSSIDENWQGPTSMAYSLLLDSNEQLFLVQFHLGCCTCILHNL